MPFPLLDAVSPESFSPTEFFQSDKSKQLFNFLKSGKGFQNPIQKQIDTTNSLLSGEILPQIDTWISQAGAALPGDPQSTPFSLVELETIKTKLEESFIPSQTALLTHTDYVSGVRTTTNGDVPNFRSILAVGSSSVALDHALNGITKNPCGRLFNAFSSIFLGQDLYLQINDFYQNLIGNINNTEATYEQVLGQIEAYEQQITGLVTNSEEYFDSMVNDLIFNSVTQTLPGFYESPCGKHILEKLIGTSDLISLL